MRQKAVRTGYNPENLLKKPFYPAADIILDPVDIVFHHRVSHPRKERIELRPLRSRKSLEKNIVSF
jgi:hypothetical protein